MSLLDKFGDPLSLLIVILILAAGVVIAWWLIAEDDRGPSTVRRLPATSDPTRYPVAAHGPVLSSSASQLAPDASGLPRAFPLESRQESDDLRSSVRELLLVVRQIERHLSRLTADRAATRPAEQPPRPTSPAAPVRRPTPRSFSDVRSALVDIWNAMDWSRPIGEVRSAGRWQEFDRELRTLGGRFHDDLRGTYALVQIGDDPAAALGGTRLLLFPYLRRDASYYSTDFFRVGGVASASRLVQPAEVRLRPNFDLEDQLNRLRAGHAKLDMVFDVILQGAVA